MIRKIFNILKRFLPEKMATELPVWLFMQRDFDRPCGYGEVYSVTLAKAFDTFLTETERNDKQLLKNLTKDIVRCWVRYKALPYEYFLFSFRNHDEQWRASFETDIDRISTLQKVSDKKMFLTEINNKYNFYKLAKDYFGRKVMLLDENTAKEEFVAFVMKNKNVFIKPLESSQGRGARRFDYEDESGCALLYEELQKVGGAWMVEQLIVQDSAMAQWNPTSVNTIRIPTFLRDGKFTVIWTRMRMGKKGSVVDNAGAGGIVVNVDPQTGVVTTDGIDEAYNHFEQHPDAGLTFKGWQVPRWQELLQVVEELHRTVFPKHIYIAWDFALTDAGWVVIEGNWGQLLGQQTASQVGEKRKFHELLGA